MVSKDNPWKMVKWVVVAILGIWLVEVKYIFEAFWEGGGEGFALVGLAWEAGDGYF